MTIKKWFLQKNLSQQEYQAIQNGYELEILKETEKAYQVKLVTDFGNIMLWVPKSVVGTTPKFEIGQEINHKYFGKGIVLEIEENIIKVKFNEEVKTLAASYFNN